MVDLHPNLITYFDKHEDRDFIYLAIEKCEGNLENLIELMKEIKSAPPGNTDWHNKTLGSLYKKDPSALNSPEFITSLMHQALLGVKFLHENGIVHRDIKPHNLLINKLKHVKLSDMGLSKQLSDDQVSYHTEMKGSLGWQPPEVLLSE